MKARIFLAGFLAALAGPAQSQPAPEQPVEIVVEVDKPTQYQLDTFDVSKLAKDPGPTTAVPRTFQQRISIGDIVAVNGKPARGLWTTQILEVFHRVNPSPVRQSPISTPMGGYTVRGISWMPTVHG